MKNVSLPCCKGNTFLRHTIRCTKIFWLVNVELSTDNLPCALIPSDICRVSGWDGNPITTNTYNIDVVLGETRIEFVNAVRGPLKNIDMIIGMDVISQGDFHITHSSYTTMLEFEVK